MVRDDTPDWSGAAVAVLIFIGWIAVSLTAIFGGAPILGLGIIVGGIYWIAKPRYPSPPRR